MTFTLERSIEILERTPDVLIAMLQNILTNRLQTTKVGKHGVYMILSDILFTEKELIGFQEQKLFFQKSMTKNLNLLTLSLNLKKVKENH